MRQIVASRKLSLLVPCGQAIKIFPDRVVKKASKRSVRGDNYAD